jgi:energy-coupling factor transporter ATP-binding protein EcfA2
VERVHQLEYHFAEGDLAALLHRFEQLRFRGAVVGPHGSGKTTLLAELAAALRDAGHHLIELRLNEENRPRSRELLIDCCRRAGPGTIFVLDGAEQLTFFQWRRFLRRSRQFRGLLITTHSAGRLPTLHLCRTSVALLERIVTELAPDDPPEPAELSRLYRRHRGNLRDCLRELYDRAE